MNTLDATRARITAAARGQRGQYSGDADRPLGGYLATMTVYTAVVGALAAAGHPGGRPELTGAGPCASSSPGGARPASQAAAGRPG